MQFGLIMDLTGVREMLILFPVFNCYFFYRYQKELPMRIKARGKEAHLTHEELCLCMKWKLSVRTSSVLACATVILSYGSVLFSLSMQESNQMGTVKLLRIFIYLCMKLFNILINLHKSQFPRLRFFLEEQILPQGNGCRSQCLSTRQGSKSYDCIAFLLIYQYSLI